jgi:regulator of RNase E activity RraA
MQTVEVNGAVEIRGVPCNPGDLVCADEAGVAILPQSKLAAVLEVCLRIDAADTKRKADIDAGVPISELVTKQYK